MQSLRFSSLILWGFVLLCYVVHIKASKKHQPSNGSIKCFLQLNKSKSRLPPLITGIPSYFFNRSMIPTTHATIFVISRCSLPSGGHFPKKYQVSFYFATAASHMTTSLLVFCKTSYNRFKKKSNPIFSYSTSWSSSSCGNLPLR